MNKLIKEIKYERKVLLFLTIAIGFLFCIIAVFFGMDIKEIAKESWGFSDFKFLFIFFIFSQLTINFMLFVLIGNHYAKFLRFLKLQCELKEKDG